MGRVPFLTHACPGITPKHGEKTFYIHWSMLKSPSGIGLTFTWELFAGIGNFQKVPGIWHFHQKTFEPFLIQNSSSSSYHYTLRKLFHPDNDLYEYASLLKSLMMLLNSCKFCNGDFKHSVTLWKSPNSNLSSPHGTTSTSMGYPSYFANAF